MTSPLDGMTRADMDALIDAPVNLVPYSGYVEIKRETLGELLRLARLGAKVAAPSEAELMRVARRLYRLEHGIDNTPFDEVCLSESQLEYWVDQACAALSALAGEA